MCFCRDALLDVKIAVISKQDTYDLSEKYENDRESQNEIHND